MNRRLALSRAELSDGWKKEIATILKELGLVDERYTGKIVLNVLRGRIAEVEKTERLK